MGVHQVSESTLGPKNCHRYQKRQIVPFLRTFWGIVGPKNTFLSVSSEQAVALFTSRFHTVNLTKTLAVSLFKDFGLLKYVWVDKLAYNKLHNTTTRN